MLFYTLFEDVHLPIFEDVVNICIINDFLSTHNPAANNQNAFFYYPTGYNRHPRFTNAHSKSTFELGQKSSSELS